MTTSIREIQKLSYLLVKFAYVGTAPTTTYRYTDNSSDVLNDEMLGGSTFNFVSIPTMEVKPGTYIGGLEEKTTTIEMTKSFDAFMDRISDGTPHAPVRVTVWEVINSSDGGSVQQIMLFRGRLAKAVRNTAGKSDRVAFECTSVKTRLQVAAGLPCNHHCVNVFTDQSAETGVPGKNCTIDMNPILQSGTLTTISAAKQVVITGLTVPGGAGGVRYFHRGYVEYDGLRIQIRDWTSATATVFQLSNFPPQSWVGKTVTVAPGCDKTIETCRARWGNEANFNGFGFAIPSRNPVLEK